MKKEILIIFILLSSIASAQLADSPWPTFHGNNQRTGLSQYDTSHVDGTILWKFETGSGIESSPVIDKEGNIYFGTTDCYVYAVSKQGDLKWKTKIGTPQLKGYGESLDHTCIPGTPSIDSNGNIYITTRDQKLVALDSEGNVLWEFIINLTPDHFGSPAIGLDGTIYVLGSPPDDGFKEAYQQFGGFDDTEYIKDNPPLGGLYALNKDGSEKWHYNVGYRMFNSPSIDKNGLIYIAVQTDYNERKLIVLNQDGSVAWEVMLPMEVESSPAITEDGTVYIGSFDQNEKDAGLFSINKEGVNWHYTVGQKEVFTTPAIDNDGIIYIGSMVDKVFAINPDGTEKWNLDVGGTIESSLSIGAEGTIYFGINSDVQGKPNIFALNPDGTIKWSYTTEMHASIMATPAIGSDGTVYFAPWDGNLYAFGSKDQVDAEDAVEIEEEVEIEGKVDTKKYGNREDLHEEFKDERSFFTKIFDFFRKLFGNEEIKSYERHREIRSDKKPDEVCISSIEYEEGEPILSMPFKLEDYDANYWGMVPYCADPWKSGNIHYALDFELKKDAKVYASTDGIVEKTGIGQAEGSGEVINVIGDGFSLGYSGLGNLQVKEGDVIKKGDYIGNVVQIPHGEYHVHLGISFNGKEECPIKYMDEEFKEATKEMFAKAHYLNQDEYPCVCNC